MEGQSLYSSSVALSTLENTEQAVIAFLNLSFREGRGSAGYLVEDCLPQSKQFVTYRVQKLRRFCSKARAKVCACLAKSPVGPTGRSAGSWHGWAPAARALTTNCCCVPPMEVRRWVSWCALTSSCTSLGMAPCSRSGAWLAGHSARLRISPTVACRWERGGEEKVMAVLAGSSSSLPSADPKYPQPRENTKLRGCSSFPHQTSYSPQPPG